MGKTANDNANHQPEKTLLRSVKAMDLVYVRDTENGIKRKKKQDRFDYYYNDRKVSNKKQLQRIKELAIPPAWEQVWICRKANGHLQATGFDTKDRKQYLYHADWIAMRGKNKFHRMYAFGKKLPLIRRNLEKDLRQKGTTRRKVLAAIVRLMEQTHIRIGNEIYEKQNGSYGLSTLQDKNVHLGNSKLRFIFTGKKGNKYDITIRNKRLARIVKNCREIPGEQLFQYLDENGDPHAIHSEDVNAYIGEISGEDFTSKDFRTWSGTANCIRALKNKMTEEEQPPVNKMIVAALDEVADALGNTRAVCRKYYVHPAIIKAFENGRLQASLQQINRGSRWLTAEERIALQWLKPATTQTKK